MAQVRGVRSDLRQLRVNASIPDDAADTSVGGDLPRSADIRVLGVSVFAPKADAGADADVVIANATNLSRQTISDNLPPSLFKRGRRTDFIYSR